MKYIITVFISLFYLGTTTLVQCQDMTELTSQCAASAGDVTYLKDFPVSLDAGAPGGKPPTAQFSFLLSKNTAYRFSICTAADSEGEAVLELYELGKRIGTTYFESTGKEFPFFDLKVQSTGVYHLFISFKDGKPGQAVGIMSFIKRL